MEKSTFSNQNRVSIWQPLTIRNFLLLFIGENVSLLGDQLYLVALPWLTIQLTNSGLSLGTVLMTSAIPLCYFNTGWWCCQRSLLSSLDYAGF